MGSTPPNAFAEAVRRCRGWLAPALIRMKETKLASEAGNAWQRSSGGLVDFD